MVQRYFVEPYRFIPPYRSTIWCRIARFIVPRHLRRGVQVTRWRFQGLEHAQQSLQQKAGVLLAGNHCRAADPMLMGMLGVRLRRFCYFVVSYHLFKISRLNGWWINRLGGYSILREGADREAIRATANLLAEGNRPIVIFPEGTWFRQNDRLGPLQEGVSLMVRQAVKQSDRPILVHPVAIKYWALVDPRPELHRRLAGLETRLGWQPQSALDLIPRLEKVCSALLAIKEIELTGRPALGSLDERVRNLAAGYVAGVEQQLRAREADGHLLERIRRLRLRLVRQLAEEVEDPVRMQETRRLLDQLLLAENLNAHSMEYLLSRPSLERLIETVQRIEETVHDQAETSVVPHGAVVSVGPAIDVRALTAAKSPRNAPDPFMQRLAEGIQALLDQMLAEGPPPDWECPPRIEPMPSAPAPTAALAQAALAQNT